MALFINHGERRLYTMDHDHIYYLAERGENDVSAGIDWQYRTHRFHP